MIKRFLVIIGLGAVFFSCASKPDYAGRLDEAVDAGNYEGALAVIEESQTPAKGKDKPKYPLYPEGDKILYSLDKGTLEHYAGQYEASAQDMQDAERAIEDAYTKSLTQEIGSYFADDTVKDYSGEDYEDIYANVFSALNYYQQGDAEGAGAEIRKITEKIKFLADKYVVKEDSSVSAKKIAAFVKNAIETAAQKAGLPIFELPIPDEILKPDPMAVQLSDSALARYLSAIFYRGEGENREDDCRIDLEAISNIYQKSPNVYAGSVPSSIAGEFVDQIPEGKARLNIIGFAGESPFKMEKITDIPLDIFPTLALLKPLDDPEKRITVGNLALPVFEDIPSVIDSVEVEAGGQTVTLELLEDIGAVMKETFNFKYPSIRTKTYIRALIKYISVEVAAQTAKAKGSPDMLVVRAAVGAKKTADASEKADTRMTKFFPAKAYIGGINLDPGKYTVTIKYLSQGAPVETVQREIAVAANKTNLVEGISLK